jgi:hypothetical protein
MVTVAGSFSSMWKNLMEPFKQATWGHPGHSSFLKASRPMQFIRHWNEADIVEQDALVRVGKAEARWLKGKRVVGKEWRMIHFTGNVYHLLDPFDGWWLPKPQGEGGLAFHKDVGSNKHGEDIGTLIADSDPRQSTGLTSRIERAHLQASIAL